MSGYKLLVTGGTGFLGQHIVNELLSPDSNLPIEELRLLHMTDYKDVQDDRIVLHKGDIRDKAVLEAATAGMDAVIHSAAVVDWGTKKPREVYEVNYVGTENVIAACRKNRVSSLVYTSSLDATYTGKPLVDIDENAPYPESFANMYCQSKSEAEQLVLRSNDEEMRTCAIRPADIWGADDPYHIDSLVDMAKSGFYVRLGNGDSKCQHVYVGNCAYAHVMAAKGLLEGKSAAYGQAYFVTDGPAENFFTFFDKIVLASGYKIWPKNLWLPKGLAYTIGAVSELFAKLVRPIKYYNPKFSRFAVDYTCTDYTFTSKKAQKDFGFLPKYSHEDALAKTIAHYKV